MNDDHSLIAFTLEIGSSEKIIGGVKNMNTGEIYSSIKLENIS